MQHRSRTPLWRTRLCKNAVAKNYNLRESTVRNILNRAHENRGDPIRPRGHNEWKLTTAGQHKLFNTLDRKPWATNRKLAATVGHRIGLRSEACGPGHLWCRDRVSKCFELWTQEDYTSWPVPSCHSRVLYRGGRLRCCVGLPDSLPYNFAS